MWLFLPKRNRPSWLKNEHLFFMTEETKDDVLDVEDTEDTSVNWEAKFTKLKERQRSAKTAYETRIAELEGQVKTPVKELKDLKSDFGLLEKGFLRVAGITTEDEVSLAQDIQKKTGLDWDKLIDDDYFKHKLDNLRTVKANQLATNVKGDGKTGNEQDNPQYWIDKGERPKDRETYKKVIGAMLKQGKGEGKKFYND